MGYVCPDHGASRPASPSVPGLSGEDEAELRALQIGVLELKALVSDLRLDLALRRLGRKYSPDQLRDRLGRWTDGSETNDVRRILNIAKRTRFSASGSDYQR